MGDFGLTGKSGGTPIFMAPEGLNKDSRLVEKTDLYSFAVMILFLMFPTELVIQLLFLPIEENWEELTESLSDFPILLWIINSLVPDAGDRADFDTWKIIIQEIKSFDKDWLRGQINSDILQQNGVILAHLNNALDKEGGLYFYILDHFGYDIRWSQVNENGAYKMSPSISQKHNLPVFQFNTDVGKISQGKIFLTPRLSAWTRESIRL